MNYYISDLHFSHSNILAYDNRPYFTTDEMNTALIDNWNIRVGNNDNVYILGDMFWKNESAIEILEELKGNKYLILGNHDRLSSEMKKRFVWVKEYAEIKDNSRHVIMSHYPIPFFKNMTREDYYMLYGHVHKSWDYNMIQTLKKQIESLYQVPCKMYTVGCMVEYMNYTPRTLDEIIKGSEDNGRILRNA